jgi:hypothetical protein
VDVGSSHSEDMHFVTDTEDLLNVKATAVVSKSALISETPAWNSLKVGETFCFFLGFEQCPQLHMLTIGNLLWQSILQCSCCRWCM